MLGSRKGNCFYRQIYASYHKQKPTPSNLCTFNKTIQFWPEQSLNIVQPPHTPDAKNMIRFTEKLSLF